MDRAETCGYSSWVPFFQKDGYAILKDFLKPEQLPNATDFTPGLDTGEIGSMVKRSTTGVHIYEPYASLASNAVLVEIVKEILRDQIYIHQSRINYKLPFVGTGWHWHSDFETWHSQDGMPGMNCLSVMMPLSENTAFNGPLLVVPGSHKKFYCAPASKTVRSAQENFADQKEGLPDEKAMGEALADSEIVAITCNPGDIVLFDCNILHGSVANMTNKKRTNLFFVYNSLKNRLVDPFNGQEPRPEEMGTRNILKLL